MSRPLLILDRQHAGKRGRGDGTGRPEDLGAAADIDGDGQIATWEQEANLTPVYRDAASRYLSARGIPTIPHDPLGSGLRANYGERHEYANGIAADWPGLVGYGALHLNAGGGAYGMVGYDPRSRMGRELAHCIAEQLEARVPVLSRCLAQPLEGHWSRGLVCIDGIYSGPANICGVLLEPLFMDNADHAAYINKGGLTEVGNAIGAGFVQWSLGGGHDA